MNNHAGLPDFIQVTNYCESLDYEIIAEYVQEFIYVNVYFEGILIKKGTKPFTNSIEAQKESYYTLYKNILKKS